MALNQLFAICYVNDIQFNVYGWGIGKDSCMNYAFNNTDSVIYYVFLKIKQFIKKLNYS
jgi:hypothetical protein